MRELAAFAGCRPQDLALLPNATTGVRRQPACWKPSLQCTQISRSPRLLVCMRFRDRLNLAHIRLPLATGLNTVVQSWRGRLGPGDALFSLDIGYGSVKKMLALVAEQSGAQHVEMPVQLPLR